MAEEVNTSNNVNIDLDNTETADLAGFFDLLAKFDYQDKHKSLSGTDPLVSAPKGSALDTD